MTLFTILKKICYFNDALHEYTKHTIDLYVYVNIDICIYVKSNNQENELYLNTKILAWVMFIFSSMSLQNKKNQFHITMFLVLWQKIIAMNMHVALKSKAIK